jgi:hypothetical protein
MYWEVRSADALKLLNASVVAQSAEEGTQMLGYGHCSWKLSSPSSPGK